jgi:hypothetical protein
MHIMSHVDLTSAQEHAIRDFELVIVDDARDKDVDSWRKLPCAVAAFKTFQGQEVKVTIDKNGVINHIEFTP